MAWTAPATAAVGTLNTAALWNAIVRDNLLWLSSPVRCRAEALSTNQSIANSTVTAVTWNAESYDTANMHSTTTNPTRITIPNPGTYAISANLWWSASAAGYRQIWLYKNGSSLGLYGQAPGVGAATSMSLYDELPFVAGDYVEVWVEQSSGAALTINASAGDLAYFTARLVSN